MSVNNTTDGRELGWDDTIQQESSFTMLPEGEYGFTVVSFERGRYDGGSKIPACPKAIVTLRVDGGEEGEVDIKHNFYLHSRCEGIISAFFISIGMKKHGEPLKMNWPGTIGRTGRAKIIIDKYQGNDGRDYENNKVKRFLEPSAAEPAKAFTPGKF